MGDSKGVSLIEIDKKYIKEKDRKIKIDFNSADKIIKNMFFEYLSLKTVKFLRFGSVLTNIEFKF